jgi:hypothetical protein
MSMHEIQFHLTWNGPLEPHWPRGSWSLYQITGDQIAQRIEFKRGKVVRRHSWCGYVGMYATLAEATRAILDIKDGRNP